MIRKDEEGKIKIWDKIRKKHVVYTPEENVRQQYIDYMLNVLKIPLVCIAVETGHSQYGRQHRTDILVYTSKGEIFMIVECKAPSIALDEKVLQQLSRYQHALSAQHWVLTNGKQCYYFKRKSESEGFERMEGPPLFSLHR